MCLLTRGEGLRRSLGDVLFVGGDLGWIVDSCGETVFVAVEDPLHTWGRGLVVGDIVSFLLHVSDLDIVDRCGPPRRIYLAIPAMGSGFVEDTEHPRDLALAGAKTIAGKCDTSRECSAVPFAQIH